MSKTLEELNVGTYDNMHIVCILIYLIETFLFLFNRLKKIQQLLKHLIYLLNIVYQHYLLLIVKEN
jgi:hypothetical protein